MEGIPALAFWDLVISVMHPGLQAHRKVLQNVVHNLPDEMQILANVDYVPPTLQPIDLADMVIMEDNDAVIKMCEKGRSPNMRHVARTHRVDLDWLFERLIKDPAIKMRYVNTKQQIADMFTKGSFTEMVWKTLLNLIQIAPTRGKASKE